MVGERFLEGKLLSADVAGVLDVVVKRVFVPLHAGLGFEEFAAYGASKLSFGDPRYSVLMHGNVIRQRMSLHLLAADGARDRLSLVNGFAMFS